MRQGARVILIQHSAHIPPGRDGLFNLIRSTPATLKYEPGLIVAENDYVIVHGRFSGIGRPRNWIAADVVRVADGVLAEHSRNTGMSCRMKRPKGSREAVCRCSGPRFPSERSQSLSSRFSPLSPKDQLKPNAQWQDGMSALDAVDGSSTGTEVSWMWVLLRPP